MLCLANELPSLVFLKSCFGYSSCFSGSSLSSLLELLTSTAYKLCNGSFFSFISLNVYSIGLGISYIFDYFFFEKNLYLIAMGNYTATNKNKKNAMQKVQAIAAALEGENVLSEYSTT